LSGCARHFYNPCYRAVRYNQKVTKPVDIVVTVLRRLVTREGNETKAGKLLGISQNAVNKILNQKSGAGLEVRSGLAREYPADAFELMQLSPEVARVACKAVGHCQPSPAPSASGDYQERLLDEHPELRPVWEMRSRAIRAYLELHPEADRDAIVRGFDWVVFAMAGEPEHDADWWFGKLQETTKRVRELEESRLRAMPGEASTDPAGSPPAPARG
jgi:hypothetical protein